MSIDMNKVLATMVVVGLVVTTVWAAVKLAWQRVTGTPMPRNALTLTLDVLVEILPNLVGAATKASGVQIFWPTVPTRLDSALPSRPTPPPTIPPAGGAALVFLVGALALGGVALAIGGAALGCHPVLPPVAGCTPGAESCVRGQPHVCSGSQRWEPRGDEVCGAVLEGEPPRVCVMLDGGAARCRTPRDGGVSDAEQ